LTGHLWIDAPHDVRLRRGLERDGAAARTQWDAWMCSEDDYVRYVRPAQTADRRIAGGR